MERDVSGDKKPPSETRPAKLASPTAGRNWRRYLWMVVGGVAASGTTSDRLWGWRTRVTVVALIAVLFLLLWLLTGPAHH